MTHPHRGLEIAAFLDQNGWGAAEAQAFDGDFSSRRYARLVRADGVTAILMDADPDQKTSQFVGVAGLLRKYGVTAPEMIAADAAHGLVLMQDFGVRNIGALIDVGNEAAPFYLRAAGVLAKLHNGFDRGEELDLDLPLFNTDLFVTQVELFLDAWFPFIQGRAASEEERQDFRAAWRAVLRPMEVMPKSLMLRDFMPDNLMDLANGETGVLDFQDAGIGPVAYDMASLCEEVRRDGGFALLPPVIAYYRERAQSSLSEADLTRACIILSAQRHTRILGIIAQRVVKTGRRDKLDFAPRIQTHLNHIMKETYLLPVREWMDGFKGLLS